MHNPEKRSLFNKGLPKHRRDVFRKIPNPRRATTPNLADGPLFSARAGSIRCIPEK
ncbi:MAG: hypothetical protein OXF02_08210 [Simkaniaceae bacterium]|nr:hypothetical protein [Simkaniaceae bacterium]